MRLFFLILVSAFVVHAQVSVFDSDLARHDLRPPNPNAMTVAGDWGANLLVSERAPPCTTVRYVGNTKNIWQTSGTTITGNAFFLEFQTLTCAEAFPVAADQAANCDAGFTTLYPSQPLTLSVRISNTTAALVPTICTSPNGNVANTFASFTTGLITVPVSGASQSFRCYYFCSKLPTYAGSSVPIEVRLVTASNERASGIFYKVRLLERTYPISPLVLSTNTTVAFWSWSGSAQRSDSPFATDYSDSAVATNAFTRGAGYFSLAGVSKHYYVDVAPFGSTPGIFWAYASTDSTLVFSINNIRQTQAGVADVVTFAGQHWQITLNSDDVACNTFTTATGYGTANPFPAQLQSIPAAQACVVSECSSTGAAICQNNLLVTSNSIRVGVSLSGCKLLQNQKRRYYVAVRLPQAPAAGKTWSFVVEARFSALANKVLPALNLRIPTANGQIMTGVLGDDADVATTIPAYDNYFMLNYGQSGYGIPSESTIQNPYIVLSVYGASHGKILMELTKGKEKALGNRGRCGTTDRIMCRAATTGVDFKNDCYCRLVVRNCARRCTSICPRALSPPATCTDKRLFHDAANLGKTITFGSAEDFFVTVWADPEDISITAATANDPQYNGITTTSTDYAVKFEIRDDTAMNVKTATSVIGSTWMRETNGDVERITHIGSVEEQTYMHYVITFDSAVANDPETYFHYELYTNHEQDEVRTYWNEASLAGSSANVGLTVTDSCYGAKGWCETRLKSVSSDRDDTTQNNLCWFSLRFCDITANVPYYFSVYGIHSSDAQGYDRSIKYTATWTTRKAQPVYDRMTTSEYIYPRAQQATGTAFTYQYRIDIPTAQQTLLDRVRVRFADVQGPGKLAAAATTLTGYIQCGRAAGNCPCYSSFATATATDTDDDNGYNDLIADACACKSNSYYVTFTDVFAYKIRPIVFTLTPYLTFVTIKSELKFSGFERKYVTGSLEVDGSNDFIPVVYRLTNLDTSSDDALELTIKYVHRLGRAPAGDPLETIAMDVNFNAPPQLSTATPLATSISCGSRCIATQVPNTAPTEMFSYCTIVIQPCEFAYGEYIIRVSGNNAKTAPALNQPVDFTIYYERVDNSPVTLASNVPIASSIRGRHYKHYSYDYSLVPANGYLKAELYIERDQGDDVFFFWTTGTNTTTRAGTTRTTPCPAKTSTLTDYTCPNFGFSAYCKTDAPDANLWNERRSYCSLYLSACQVPASGILYLSVYAQGARVPAGLSTDLRTTHHWGDIAIDYTIFISTQAPTPLALTAGYPVTGQVHVAERMYYSFTATAADFTGTGTSGNFLTITVDCIKPALPCANCLPADGASTPRLKTHIYWTATPETANCPCTNVQFVDEIEFRQYHCDLTPLPRTYYIEILGLRTGSADPFDPVSYTVRAYRTVIATTAVTVHANAKQDPIDLGNTCTRLTTDPCPLTNSPALDYEEWRSFAINVSPSTDDSNRVFYFEIMNLKFGRTAATTHILDAYLNKDISGSPPSYFRRTSTLNPGTLPEAWETSSLVLNKATNDNGCSLARCTGVDSARASDFTFSATNPEQSCSLQLGDCRLTSGTYYLTVMITMREPEPDISRRVNFSVRVRSAPIDVTTLATYTGVIPTTAINLKSPNVAAVDIVNRFVQNVEHKVHRYFMKTPAITISANGYFVASTPTTGIVIAMGTSTSLYTSFITPDETARMFPTSTATTCTTLCACPAGLVPAGAVSHRCFLNCNSAASSATAFYIMVQTTGAKSGFRLDFEHWRAPTVAAGVTVPLNNVLTAAVTYPQHTIVTYTVDVSSVTTASLDSTVTITTNIATSAVTVSRDLATATFTSPWCTKAHTHTATGLTLDTLRPNCEAQGVYQYTFYVPAGQTLTGFQVKANVVNVARVALTSGSRNSLTFTTQAVTTGDWAVNTYQFVRTTVELTFEETMKFRAKRALAADQFNLYLQYGMDCRAGINSDYCSIYNTINGAVVCTLGTTDTACFRQLDACGSAAGTYTFGVKSKVAVSNGNSVTITMFHFAQPTALSTPSVSLFSALSGNSNTAPLSFPGTSGSLNDVLFNTMYVHFKIVIDPNSLLLSDNTGLLTNYIKNALQFSLTDVTDTKSVAMYINRGKLAANPVPNDPIFNNAACFGNLINVANEFTCTGLSQNVATNVVGTGSSTVVLGSTTVKNVMLCRKEFCSTAGFNFAAYRSRTCGETTPRLSDTYYVSVAAKVANVPSTETVSFSLGVQFQNIALGGAALADGTRERRIFGTTVTPLAGPPVAAEVPSDANGIDFSLADLTVNTQVAKVLYIPITVAGFVDGDYLSVNLTSSNVVASANIWQATECEPLLTTVGTSQIANYPAQSACITSTTATHYTGHCYIQTDPCNFQSGNAAGNQVWWLRISVQTGTLAPFHVRISKMTPYRKAVSLAPYTLPLPLKFPATPISSSYFTETGVLWEERWAQYKITVTEKSRRSFLYVSVTSHCTTLQVFVTKNGWRYASELCNERKDAVTAGGVFRDDNTNLKTCIDAAGDYFISVKADLRAINDYLPATVLSTATPPVDTFTPGYKVGNPQVSYTIVAEVIKLPVTNLNLECATNLYHNTDATSGAINCGGPIQLFEVETDHENFGSQLTFELSNCLACTVTVVYPVFRRTFNPTNKPLSDYASDWWDTTFLDTPASTRWPNVAANTRSCPIVTNAAFGDSGVQEMTGTAGSVKINVDVCDFENGKYYVSVRGIPANQATPAVIKVYHHIQEIPIATLVPANGHTVVWTGALQPQQDGEATNYQYYKIIVNRGTAEFLKVAFSNVAWDRALTGGIAAPTPDYYWTVFNLGRRYKGAEGDNSGGMSAANCNDFVSTAALSQCGHILTTDPPAMDQYFLGVTIPSTACGGGKVRNGVLRYTLTVTASNGFKQLPFPALHCDITVGANNRFNAFSAPYNRGFPTRPLSRWASDLLVYKVDIDSTTLTGLFSLQITGTVIRDGAVDNGNQIVVRYGANKIPVNAACQDASLTTADGTVSSPATAYTVTHSIVPVQCTGATLTTALVSTYWITVSPANGAAQRETCFTLEVKAAACTAATAVACALSPAGVTPTVITDNNFVTATQAGGSSQVFTRTISYNDLIPDVTDKNSWVPEINVYVSDVHGCQAGWTFSYGFKEASAATSSACPTAITGTDTITSCKAATRLGDGVTSELKTLQNTCTAQNYNRVYYVLATRVDPTTPTCTQNVANCEPSCPPKNICNSATAGFKIAIKIDEMGDAPPCAVNALSPTAFVTSQAMVRFPYAANSQYELWSVPAGSDGFIHVDLQRVIHNQGNSHKISMALYGAGCSLGTCSTDGTTDAEGTKTETRVQSCYVFNRHGGRTANRPGAADNFYVVVWVDGAIDSYSNYIRYMINARNTFELLTSTQTVTIQGNDRHYYKVPAMTGSSPQSVIVRANTMYGNRLTIDAADQSSFVDFYTSGDPNNNVHNVATQTPITTGGGYRGWRRRMLADHNGQGVEIDINTRAQHPHAPFLYIWVTPSLSPTDKSPFDEVTSYSIGATVGSSNCGSIGTGFCTSTGPGGTLPLGSSLSSGVFTHHNITGAHLEAQCRYKSLSTCYCPKPDNACLDALKAFACLNTFRECDANGFWVGICRDQCALVEEACGPFIPKDSLCDSADCFALYSCSCNSRYLDGPDSGSTQCSGIIRTSTASPIAPPTTAGPSPTVVASSSPSSIRQGPPGPPGPQGPAGPPGSPGSPGGDGDIGQSDTVDVRVDFINSASGISAPILVLFISSLMYLFSML